MAERKTDNNPGLLHDKKYSISEDLLWGALFYLVALLFSTNIEFHFTLPKLAALRIATLLLVGLWMFRLKRGQLKTIPCFIFLPFLTLAAWWVLSTFFALHMPTALNGVHNRYNGLWSHGIYLVLFLIVASLPADENRIRRILHIFITALIPAALYAIMQYYHLDPFPWPAARPASTIGHPVPLAALLGLAIPFVLTLLIREENKIYWGAVLAIFLSAVLVTLSRGPWIGIIISSSAVIGFNLKGKTIKFTNKHILLFILLLCGVSILLGYKGIAEIRDRVKTFTAIKTDVSLMGRVIYYKAALRAINEYPLFGTGFESFKIIYPRYRPLEDNKIFADTTPTMVHNGYLQTALTNGIPALLFYLVFLSSVMLFLVRTYKKTPNMQTKMLALAFITSVSSYLIQDFSGWLDIALTPFFWIILGLSVSFCSEANELSPLGQRWRISGLFLGVICAALLLFLSVRTIKDIRANIIFRELKSLGAKAAMTEIEPRISEGLSMVQGDYYYEDLAAALYAMNFEVSGNREYYRKGTELLEAATVHNPFDTDVLIHRVALDTAALRKGILKRSANQAEDAALKLLVMDKHNAALYEAVARLRAAEKRFSAAIELIEKAKFLRPGNNRYLLLEGDLYYQMNDTSRAVNSYRTIMADMEKKNTYSQDWLTAKRGLALVFLGEKEYSSALREVAEAIEHFPGNASAYILQGDIYATMNNFPKAGESFAAALTLEPSNPYARKGIEQLEAISKK
ncbi:MAG: O-antigen ligase family protein [Nitrospirae bacterium]|nr:O-antigen ligase family protein [Nitrospirota bacterium]